MDDCSPAAVVTEVDWPNTTKAAVSNACAACRQAVGSGHKQQPELGPDPRPGVLLSDNLGHEIFGDLVTALLAER